MEKAPVICVVGPTASGKSALAQSLACAIGGEIVSADSMQVYRGMDIGTSKVLPEERLVPHYGLDLVDPGEPYSAALFQSYARSCFQRIQDSGKTALLCGGTGFYVRAAMDDYEFPKGEQVGNPLRDELNAFARENGAQALWERLAAVDSKSAEVIPPNDVKRVVRAFELLEEGLTYADQREKLSAIPQFWPGLFIGLSVDPDVLRARIDERVEVMVEQGLVEEVEGLIARGFREGVTAPYAIGYREIAAYLDGEITLEQAKESIKVSTRRYAKRQRTWFRKDKRITWIDANTLDLSAMTDCALEIVRTNPLFA